MTSAEQERALDVRMRLRKKYALHDKGNDAAPAENSRATLRPSPSPKPGVVGAMNIDQFANARWYAVQTQPHTESQATYHLESQGYRVFCPRYRKIVRHARKTKSILAPLFPNYLFVRLDISRDHWRSVNGTRGVVRLLMRGETPQPVPNRIVDGLQAQMRADGTIDWMPALKIGGDVRIVDGPFAEFLGKLEYFDAAGRVRVLLDLLGRTVSVALRSDGVMPAA
jgi:transcription elongation factor/antiterminator RfaH